MKTLVKVLMVLVVVALVVPAFGQDAKPKRERPTAFGVITKVDAKTIELKVRTDPKDKNSPTEPKTFDLAPADKLTVTIDGETKTVGDLKADMRCGLWVNDKLVTKISVRTGEHKKPPADQPKP